MALYVAMLGSVPAFGTYGSIHDYNKETQAAECAASEHFLSLKMLSFWNVAYASCFLPRLPGEIGDKYLQECMLESWWLTEWPQLWAKMATLNIRNELVSTCRHRKKSVMQ